MVYRLEERAKFRRIRRLRYYSEWIRLAVLALIIGISSLFYLVHTPKLQSQTLTLHGDQTSALHHPQATSNATPHDSKSSNGSAHAAPKGNVSQQTSGATLLTANCNNFATPTPGLASADDPGLRKLAQYQQACNGQLAARSSFFVPTPSSVSEAQSDANDVAARLKSYAQYGIAPLVFMEPNDVNGTNLDLAQYKNGAYDSALDAYFADIKAAGITDSMMGMWVMLPEGNLPEWSSVDPATYAADVTKVAGFQKKYFPSSQTTIMLDSETYPSANSWDGGAYVSLLPYVQGIPKGLLNSFGLQGFPWSPPATQSGDALNNPQEYLRTDFAAEAAHTLGVSSIWLNTGTFNQMYASSPAETVANTPLQRQAMLNGVLAEAEGLQGQGFTVSIHLFAQDKASDSEGIDWSYWQAPGDSPNTAVFKEFAHQLFTANIPLWIFDTY